MIFFILILSYICVIAIYAITKNLMVLCYRVYFEMPFLLMIRIYFDLFIESFKLKNKNIFLMAKDYENKKNI